MQQDSNSDSSHSHFYQHFFSLVFFFVWCLQTICYIFFCFQFCLHKNLPPQSFSSQYFSVLLLHLIRMWCESTDFISKVICAMRCDRQQQQQQKERRKKLSKVSHASCLNKRRWKWHKMFGERKNINYVQITENLFCCFCSHRWLFVC